MNRMAGLGFVLLALAGFPAVAGEDPGKREKEREKLEKILTVMEDSTERPDVLFRLAEIYLEEALAYPEQAGQWREKAIAAYRELAQKYPNYPRGDEALFYLAYTLWEQEKQKEALDAYKLLVKNFPSSKYIPDAYLAFGEYYFSQAQLDLARMAYQKVAQFTDSALAPYALYKQGWCYYNLQDWGKALEMFDQVVKVADTREGASGKKLTLRTEALKDLSLTYSHAGKAEKAPEYFKKLAPSEAHGMLVTLASMYAGNGDDKQAIILYTELIKTAGCSAEAPLFQGRLLECTIRGGDKRAIAGQAARLTELVLATRKCLAGGQLEKLQEAEQEAERILRKLVNSLYQEARKTQNQQTVKLADDLAGAYLKLFPERASYIEK
jgi:TolA-binding protein